MEVYQFVVKNECPEIFPSNVCSNCIRNMRRCIESSQSKEIATFKPHCSTNCLICLQGKKGRPSLQASKGFHMKTFEKEFKDKGFVKFASGHHDGDLIYCKLEKIQDLVILLLTIKISEDGGWIISCFAKQFTKESLQEVLCTTLPDFLTDENVKGFLETLMQYQICYGNQDFSNVVQNRIEINMPFLDSCGGIYSLYIFIFLKIIHFLKLETKK